MNQKNDKAEIDSWLKKSGEWTIRKVRQVVVNAIEAERQLSSQDTFNIPLHLIEAARITDKRKLLTILTTLHKKKIVKIWRKATDETITRNPDILNYSDTQIKIFPQKFDYLVSRLNELVGQYEKAKDKASTPNEIKIIECSGIKYMLSTCELSYENGKPRVVSPEIHEMKFLFSLYKRRGEVVEDKDIAKDVGIYSYKNLSENEKVKHEDITNQDFAEDTSTLRKELRTLLLSVGMPEKEFNSFIKRIAKKGYQLVCT